MKYNKFLFIFAVLTLAFAGSAFAEVNLTDSAAVCANFEENGGTTLIDGFGNLNGSIANNGEYSWSTDRVIGAYSQYVNANLSDSGSYFDDDAILKTGALTYSFWTKVNDCSTGQLVFKWFGGGDSGYEAELNSGNIDFTFARTGQDVLFGSVACNQGVWTHYTVTFNETFDAEVWVDGVSTIKDTTSWTGALEHNTRPLSIGFNGNSNTSSADAYIDGFIQWGRGFNQSDVDEVYNAGAGVSCNQILGSSLPNFQITATNLINGTSLINLTAYIDGDATYYNNTGQIVTNLFSNASTLYNITVESFDDGGYFNQTYLNYNVSDNLNAEMFQSVLRLEAYDLAGNPIIGGNFTFGSQTANQTDDILLNAGSSTIFFNHPDYQQASQAFTLSAYENRSDNFTSVFSSLVNFTATNVLTATAIENFTINVVSLNDSFTESNTAVDDSLSFGLLNGTTYNFTFTKSGFASESVVLTLNDSSVNYTFEIYTTNSYNITFFNEITLEPINENISVEFISDTFSVNYTAENGSLYVDLLTPEDYTIRFYNENYGRLREHLITLTNATFTELSLYMLSDTNSTETTVTVYDSTTLNPVEGAIVYLQRYYIDSNSYVTVAQYETDIGGNSYFDVEHDNELYKFRVDFPWQTQQLLTDPLYVSETQLNLYINLLSPIAEELFSDLGITYSLTYDNTTQSFQLSYNDPASTASEYCLNLKTYGTYGIDTINSTCSSSASGSLSVSGFESGKTNYGAFDITTSTGTRNIATIWQELITNTLGNDRFGLFLVIIIYCVLIFMSSSSLMAGLIGTSAFPMAKLLGVINLDWGATFVPVILGLLIISFVASRR